MTINDHNNRDNHQQYWLFLINWPQKVDFPDGLTGQEFTNSGYGTAMGVPAIGRYMETIMDYWAPEACFMGNDVYINHLGGFNS